MQKWSGTRGARRAGYAALVCAVACTSTETRLEGTAETEPTESAELDAGVAAARPRAPGNPEPARPAAGDAGSSSACAEPGCANPSTPIVAPPPPPLGAPGNGACLACARANCATQVAAAFGSDSTLANQAEVALVLGCVVGTDWIAGNAIPANSCFFSDPAQPRGSLVPCYCGAAAVSSCLALGPAEPAGSCASAIATASHCSPQSPVCVTSSGSDPNVPLGDVLQLLNCERAGCESECGFPATPQDE